MEKGEPNQRDIWEMFYMTQASEWKESWMQTVAVWTVRG